MQQEQGTPTNQPGAQVVVAGSKCAQCRDWLRTGVVDSRPTSFRRKRSRYQPISTRRRRRRCFECGNTFTTYEVRMGDLGGLLRMLFGATLSDVGAMLATLTNRLGQMTPDEPLPLETTEKRSSVSLDRLWEQGKP